MGDTVIICDGTYSEGSGQVGSNAVTITKSLTIKGAGADKVTIRPTRSTRPARSLPPLPTCGTESAASSRSTASRPLRSRSTSPA